LHGSEVLEAGTVEPKPAVLRIADACGLRLRLAPGVGQISFGQVLAGIEAIDQVLAPGPDVWPAEVARAVDLLDGLGEKPSAADR
jgi:hypothetical protein